MSQKKGSPTDESTRREAERLAREGLQEIAAGEKEDGRFVLDEARKLDADAVKEVIEQQGGGGKRK